MKAILIAICIFFVVMMWCAVKVASDADDDLGYD